MANNLSLSTQSTDFVLPNIDTLRKSSKSILHNFTNLKTSYAESLQERGGRLNNYVQDFDQVFKDSMVELKANLENQKIDDSLTTLEELVTATLDSTLTAEEKIELTEEVELIKGDIKERIGGVQSLFQQKVDSLLPKTSNIKQVVIKERLQSGYNDKMQQKANLEEVAKEQIKRKNQLIAQRNQLIESLDVMRKNNIFEMFSDYIPSAEEIDGLDLAQPEVAAIKQGLTLYKKMVANIGKGLEYIKLADARVQLDQEIAALSLKMEEQNKEIAKVNSEMEDLSRLTNIDAERTKYLTEANKTMDSFTFFVQNLNSLLKIERYSAISQLLESMVNYLDTIIREYGKPI